MGGDRLKERHARLQAGASAGAGVMAAGGREAGAESADHIPKQLAWRMVIAHDNPTGDAWLTAQVPQLLENACSMACIPIPILYTGSWQTLRT